MESAYKMYLKSLTIQEKHYGKNHIETTENLKCLAGIFNERKYIKKSKKLYKKIIEIEENHYGKGNINTVEAVFCLGRLYYVSINTSLYKAKYLFEKALSIVENHYGKGHEFSAPILGALG